MSRLANSILFLTIIMLLLHFAGVLSDQPSGTGYILNNLGVTNPQNFNTSIFWTTIVAIASIAAVGVIVGSRIAGSFESAFFAGLIVPMLALVVLIITDFIIVWNLLNEIHIVLGTVVIAPIIIYTGFSIIDWSRGRDSR